MNGWNFDSALPYPLPPGDALTRPWGSAAAPAADAPRGRGYGRATAVRLVCCLILGICLGAASAPAAEPAVLPVIDSITVDKSLRRLYLIKDGRTVRTFPIALGLAPRGHKMREGDYRTPEGDYHISARKPDSSYMLSLQISYPSESDRVRAEQAEVPAGGLIMVHGRPIRPTNGRDRNYYSTRDWTDGCIAVSNAAMLEIWMMTRIGTPITIRP